MPSDRLKTWYLKNLEWERKHPKFMVCLRVFIFAFVIFVCYFHVQTILSLISLEQAIPIFALFICGGLVIALLVFLLYRKLKKTWIAEADSNFANAEEED